MMTEMSLVSKKIKVGIIEYELPLAIGISKVVEEMGYTPCKPVGSYTAAIEMIEKEKPDILLLNIVLSGRKDGIDLAWTVREDYNIPFIFLTASCDAESIERAKKVAPPVYLIRPYDKNDLAAAIEICLYNFATTRLPAANQSDTDNYLINDCLFIKQGYDFVKVRLDDIMYLESDRVYLILHMVNNNRLLVRTTLQNYLDIISSKNFVRTHRSYAVNVMHLDTITPDGLTIKGSEIPIGKAYREELINKLRLG